MSGHQLTPRRIVEELDRYIVGQTKAKRAVAVALRNRYRRLRIEGDMRAEISPKNILLIGKTGVGKTEIARRLANLAGAPFLKVEATKYTEVGYVGRDVESMVRDLVETAVNQVRREESALVEAQANAAVDERLLDALFAAGVAPTAGAAGARPAGTAARDAGHPAARTPPHGASRIVVDAQGRAQVEEEEAAGAPPRSGAAGPAGAGATPPSGTGAKASAPGGGTASASAAGRSPAPAAAAAGAGQATPSSPSTPREQLRAALHAGALEDQFIDVDVKDSGLPLAGVIHGAGMEDIEIQFRNLMKGIAPEKTRRRKMKVSEARVALQKEQIEGMLDAEKVKSTAIERVEQEGILFIDEIDKIAVAEGRRGQGPDVSREGVQRDILPIVEGTTVVTKHGSVRTDHILFIGAGAFNLAKPADLIPELQGRFPIRVELEELGEAELRRILVEPRNALVKQYQALLATEGIALEMTEDGIDQIAHFAHEVNARSENIGARRLYTVAERLLEDVLFDAPDGVTGPVRVDASYVKQKLESLVEHRDLARYIL